MIKTAVIERDIIDPWRRERKLGRCMYDVSLTPRTRSRTCVCPILPVEQRQIDFILVALMFTFSSLRGVEWVHGLFLFPLVLGKM